MYMMTKQQGELLKGELEELRSLNEGLQMQVDELETLYHQLAITAIGWQDEEDCCPVQCNHTELCGIELQTMLASIHPEFEDEEID